MKLVEAPLIFIPARSPRYREQDEAIGEEEQSEKDQKSAHATGIARWAGRARMPCPLHFARCTGVVRDSAGRLTVRRILAETLPQFPLRPFPMLHRAILRTAFLLPKLVGKDRDLALEIRRIVWRHDGVCNSAWWREARGFRPRARVIASQR